jgi:hypothetical protein
VIRVFTFKKGLLSAMGHDLCLEVGGVDIAIDGDRVKVTIRADSLRVKGAVRGGVVHQDEPSAADRATIEGHVRRDVLETASYPTIVFEGARDADMVRGVLTLHGRAQPLAIMAAATFNVELQPSRFGIAQFRALGGTLKVEDRVRIEVTLDGVA